MTGQDRTAALGTREGTTEQEEQDNDMKEEHKQIDNQTRQAHRRQRRRAGKERGAKWRGCELEEISWSQLSRAVSNCC